jgi:hypothetical protein
MKITWWSMSPNPWTPFSALPESCRFSLRAHRREMGTTWDDNEQQLVSFAFFLHVRTCGPGQTAPETHAHPTCNKIKQAHIQSLQSHNEVQNWDEFGTFWIILVLAVVICRLSCKSVNFRSDYK